MKDNPNLSARDSELPNSEQQNIEPKNFEGWFHFAQFFIKNK
jgi:hypothetical protein